MNQVSYSIPNRILYYSTILLAAFPIMPLKVQSVAIIIFLAASFAGLLSVNISVVQRKIKWVLLFSFIPLLYALYVFFSDDFSSALFQTEKRLSLIVIPIAFLLRSKPLKRKQFDVVKYVFVVACFLVVLKLFVVFMATGFLQNAWADEEFYFIFRKACEDISGFHPSYLALYVSFSISILLIWLLFDSDRSKLYLKVVVVVGVLVFSSLLWLLAARMSLFALLIALLLLTFWKLSSVKVFSFAAIVLIAAVGLSITLSPSLSKRTGQLFTSGLSMPQQEDFNETNIRLAIYSCSFNLLKNNWYTGYGPGDVYNHLNNCYNSKFDSDKLSGKNYNTHNEYFNMWIGCGLVGIILFLLMLWLPLKLAMDANQKLFILFILLFALSCLTENILSRQHGVVFYAFFNSLLFFNGVFPNLKNAV